MKEILNENNNKLINTELSLLKADTSLVTQQEQTIAILEAKLIEAKQKMQSMKARVAETINDIIQLKKTSISSHQELQQALGLERDATTFEFDPCIGFRSLQYVRDPNSIVINKKRYPFTYILDQLDNREDDQFTDIMFFGMDIKLEHINDIQDEYIQEEEKYDNIFDEILSKDKEHREDVSIADKDIQEIESIIPYTEKFITIIIQFILVHPDYKTLNQEKLQLLEKCIHSMDEKILKKFIFDELGLTSQEIFEQIRQQIFSRDKVIY